MLEKSRKGFAPEVLMKGASRRPLSAVVRMADSLAPGGLAINQLLKLKAKNLISTQQFLEMTAELELDVDQSCNCWNILNSVRLARPCNYWNILYVDALSNYWINMWNISINP